MTISLSIGSTASPKVHFMRQEIQKLLPQYRLIADAISGEVAIKDRGILYLPMPHGSNCEKSNIERYSAYKTRAIYYNATRRTLLGLVGQVFMRDPVIELPANIEALEKDATGSGIPLDQLAKEALSKVLAFSRAGIFVDYPAVEGPTSISQMREGMIRPTMYIYNAEEIINWRVTERGAEEVLSLVVLAESYPFEDDGFELKYARQFRVLSLDESGHYVQAVWRQETPSELRFNSKTGSFETKKDSNWIQYETFKPVDSAGEPFEELPFMFIGSINNDSVPDLPNLYDLASLNIAHYRNSADFEEMLFMVGQPTIVVSGLTEEWLEKTLKNEVRFGAKGGIPLPVGGAADLLQANESQLGLKAMEHKEKQMVALGARLVQERQVERTAYETKVEATSEGSVLSNVTKNVQAAFNFAIEWCLKFVSNDEQSFKFELNTDFDITQMTAEERRESVEEWQKGAIGFEELRGVLKKSGVAFMDDAEVEAEYEKRRQQQLDEQKELMANKANSNDREGNE